MAKKQSRIEVSENTTYRFCGNGQGIPGLPHEVTARQARELGLLEVLEAALKNGNYAPATHVAGVDDGGLEPPRLNRRPETVDTSNE